MYPPPSGAELTEAEARRLDDQFFASDPTAYFRARIYGLLSLYQARDNLPGPREGLAGVLGNVASSLVPPTPDEIELQVTTDAVQLRHHVAEATLRLLLSRFTHRTKEHRSLWLELVESPRQMEQVVNQLDSHLLDQDVAPVLAGLLFAVHPEATLSGEHRRAMEHALEWITRAMLIVSPGHLDLAGASNKIRHGITTTSSNDTRVTFTTSSIIDPAQIPLEALTGETATDLINSPILQYISRPPGKGGVRHGFERTLLNVDIETALSEAWLIALVHGALFYGAAFRHHRYDPAKVAIPQPPWVIGPSPKQLLRGRYLGLRFPLTTATDGSVHRKSGVATWDGGFIDMAFGPKTQGVVGPPQEDE